MPVRMTHMLHVLVRLKLRVQLLNLLPAVDNTSEFGHEIYVASFSMVGIQVFRALY